MASSAEEVIIKKITMNSDRFTSPLVLTTEQSSIVVEVNIYENITLPYLTGTIMIQDDMDLYRIGNLSGTERVDIEFVSPVNNSVPITKSFVITDIRSNKINDQASLLSCNMIEDIGYYDKIQSFSKAYDGTGEEIIGKIMEDKFGREIFANHVPSKQRKFRYIIPYLSPLQAAMVVCHKMTTENGLPYFFYSSLNSDKLVLTDLETIMNTAPFNENHPFTYSQAQTNTQLGLDQQMWNINTLDTGKLDDTLALAELGAINTLYKNIDVLTGHVRENNVDITDTFNTLKFADILDRNSTPQVDTRFVPDPDGINTNRLNQIASSVHTDVSMPAFPYSSIGTINDDYTFYDKSLKVVRTSILNHLLKNQYKAFIPGLVFSTKNVKTSVGNQINIRVLKDVALETQNDEASVVDTRRSGNFVLMSKRHIFNVQDGLHNVAIKYSRIYNPGREYE